MIGQLETLILSTAHTLYTGWGWLGVSALLIFENATGITPSEIILGLAGWMLIAESQLPPGMIFLGGLYAAFGSFIGASISYWVARLGGRPLVEKMAGWLRLDTDHIAKAEGYFNRWGPGVVLVGRVMPGVRTLINIPAGLAKMNYLSFSAVTLVGSYVWCMLLITAGYLLGHEWELISVYLKQSLPYLFAIGGVALAVYFWVSRKQPKPERGSIKE